MAVAIAGALLVVLVGRGIVVDGADSAFVRWLPWLDRTSATLFFADPTGEYLVPVTRTVGQEESLMSWRLGMRFEILRLNTSRGSRDARLLTTSEIAKRPTTITVKPMPS